MDTPIRRPRSRWVEKIHVQIVCALTLIAMFFGGHELLRPADPQGPVTFIAVGNWAGLAAAAAVLVVLGVWGGLATVSTRPAGSVLAMFCGGLAVSLRSHPIGTLLADQGDSLRGLYLQLMLETVLLGVAAIVAAAVAVMTQAAMARAHRAWTWCDPLSPDGIQDDDGLIPAWVRPGGLGLLASAKVAPGQTPAKLSGADALRQASYCLAMGTVLGIAGVLVAMRSGDRGQILFALAAALFVAAMIANSVFPVRSVLVFVLMPVLAAAALHVAMAVNTPPADVPYPWLAVAPWALALPIDWITAGGAGAMLGYWLSSRIREGRHAEDETEN